MINDRRIYKNYYTANETIIDLNYFKPVDNVCDFKLTDEVKCFPKSAFNGKNALEITFDAVHSCCEKSIEADGRFNLSDKDVMCIAVNGRSVGQLVRVTLYSSSGDEKVYAANYLSDRWVKLLFDITDCIFLCDISKIRIAFYGKGKEINKDELGYVGEVSFGNIMDMSFEKGDFLSLIKTDGVISSKTGKGLDFEFDCGNYIEFPHFEKPRYTVMNAPLSIKDTLVVSAFSETDATFEIYISTDKRRDYDETEKVEVHFGGGEIKSVFVPIGQFAASGDERLFGIKVKAVSRGRIKFLNIQPIQERDLLLDNDGKKKLSEKPVDIVNPYAFDIKGGEYSVKDFGAKGDYYTDDTAAFQKALDYAEKKGGGTLVVPAGRYIITSVRLRSNTELRLEKDAVLIQSERAEDYNYPVAYEHDNINYDIKWAHNFLVHNYPLIYADHIHNFKITGEGKIRMADSGAESLTPGYPDYPIQCNFTIHVCPIGIDRCRDYAIENVGITRAGTYHVMNSKSDRFFIDGVKMFDVRCLSADGISLCASRDCVIANCVFVSNDDAVTINPGYDDPRGYSWWTVSPGEDNSIVNIEIAHCYLNSAYGGGGKAIAIIPWASDALNPEYGRISGVYVHDCVLNGGRSVGTWCDNPFNGKQPFDNTETDDYSPVMNLVFENNEYRAQTDLQTVKVTGLVASGTSLRSSEEVVNGTFADGICNWNISGNVKTDRRECLACLEKNGRIEQILWFSCGKNRFAFTLKGKGTVYAGASGYVYDCEDYKTFIVENIVANDGNEKIGVNADEKTTVKEIIRLA